MELPPGYSLKHNECCGLISVLKDGAVIRKANKQPLTFPSNDPGQAIRFAWWHHDGKKCPTMRLPGQR